WTRQVPTAAPSIWRLRRLQPAAERPTLARRVSLSMRRGMVFLAKVCRRYAGLLPEVRPFSTTLTKANVQGATRASTRAILSLHQQDFTISAQAMLPFGRRIRRN